MINISNVFTSAYWIKEVEKTSGDIVSIAKSIVDMGDIVLMDASQDFRSDVGGFHLVQKAQSYWRN